MVSVNAKCIKYFQDNAQTESNCETIQQVDAYSGPLTKGQICVVGSMLLLYIVFIIIFVKFFVNEEKEK